MRKLLLTLLAALLLQAAEGAAPAHAIAQFQAVFLKEYINDHENKDFAKFAKTKARCHICHRGKKPGPYHNEFGKHLIALLNPEKDKKDVDKIKAALAKVVKMHSDPKDEKSPTYGELLKEGKLPGGDDIEALKKDLTEEEVKKDAEFKAEAKKIEDAAEAEAAAKAK
jgi:hypothetical protein